MILMCKCPVNMPRNLLWENNTKAAWSCLYKNYNTIILTGSLFTEAARAQKAALISKMAGLVSDPYIPSNEGGEQDRATTGVEVYEKVLLFKLISMHDCVVNNVLGLHVDTLLQSRTPACAHFFAAAIYFATSKFVFITYWLRELLRVVCKTRKVSQLLCNSEIYFIKHLLCELRCFCKTHKVFQFSMRLCNLVLLNIDF